MSYGYLGDTSTKIKQVKKNDGLISITEAYQLEKAGHESGSLQLIEEVNASSASNVIFSSIKEAEYRVHLLQICYYLPASSSYLNLQFYESGVLESAGVYAKFLQYNYWGGTQGNNQATGESQLFTGAESTTGDVLGNSYVYIHNAGDSNSNTYITLQAANGHYSTYGGGFLPQQSVVDGLKLYSHGDYTFSASLKLYGVKNL